MNPSDRQRLEELARKWLDGSITSEEQEEFSAWYNREQDKPVVIPSLFAESEAEHREKILSGVLHSTRSQKTSYRWQYAAAAVLLLLMVAYGVFFITGTNQQVVTAPAQITATDISPGSDKAILTFDDGRSVTLDEQQNGVLKDDRGVRIIKEDGMVVYEAIGAGYGKTAYNVITTPRGGQYSLRLPDGSKVWLNAASSLRFPTRFTGSQRTVELNGEAFFEIVPDSQRGEFTPFYVETKGKQTVKVLGTKFNINSYADEHSIKTTLVEGSVEILDPQGETTRLKPRQQAMLSDNGKLRVIDGVDLEEALAWRNGMWLFRETEIREILRQVARWYDVDVVYEKDIPERRFNGGISRDSRLSSILAILETSGIHFSVEGKTIKVTR